MLKQACTIWNPQNQTQLTSCIRGPPGDFISLLVLYIIYMYNQEGFQTSGKPEYHHDSYSLFLLEGSKLGTTVLEKLFLLYKERYQGYSITPYLQSQEKENLSVTKITVAHPFLAVAFVIFPFPLLLFLALDFCLFHHSVVPSFWTVSSLEQGPECLIILSCKSNLKFCVL